MQTYKGAALCDSCGSPQMSNTQKTPVNNRNGIKHKDNVKDTQKMNKTQGVG